MSDFFVSPADQLQTVFDRASENDVIHLVPGIYRQKLVIRTKGLTLIGAGPDRTRIVFGDYAKKTDKTRREYNTFRTWTVAVCADNVSMKMLGIVNDALHPEVKGQEVALTVYGDHFRMEDCILSSTQDTLFLGPLPKDLTERYVDLLPLELRLLRPLSQSFCRCLIEGTVDFIFGCGSAVFEDCEIRSVTDARGIGYVTAPAHPADQKNGFLFKNCRFTRETGVKDGSIFLGRPWRDYGLAVFDGCSYEAHICAEGFDPWSGTRRDLTARFLERPLREGRVPWAVPYSEA